MFKMLFLTFVVFLLNIAVAGAEADLDAGKALAISCKSCHGGRGLANADSIIPSLAGQQEKYLIKTLNDFKSNKRPDAVMSPIAQGLSNTDILNLAAYYSAQREVYCW